jgi:septal ring factor EnvC (AmiA/AmiB activator)
MSQSLGEMVQELEEDYDSVRQDCKNLEDQLDDVEHQLEDVTNQLNELQAFKNWVLLAYPVVVKDYECVKVIEEMANGL